LAIHAAGPERFMTLTRVGDDWQRVRSRMKRLRYAVVRELGACEWVWAVERNPRGTGYHVHAWQRGDFLDQAQLSHMADGKGMGFRVDIRRWESGGESYALKEAYALKGADGEAFLAMNGGRLTHQSRGFFVGGVREVERAAVAARLGEDAGVWEVVSLSQLHDARRGDDHDQEQGEL
jgi:hypothetical protein